MDADAVPLLRLLPEGVPAALRAIARWVCWRARPKANGKRDKVPCSPRTGRVANAQDPASWAGFAQAVAAMRRFRLDGVGVVLTGDDNLVGVDLDTCIDAAGMIAPWAMAVVADLASYAERSPSGRGVRLFAFGSLPAGRRKAGDLELYDAGRFLTVTGHHLAGTPATVERRSRELLALHARWLGDPIAVATARPTGADRADGEIEPPIRLDTWGLAIWRGERPLRKADGTVDRSRTLYALACVLARAGATAGTIAAALAERDRALGLGKYADRRDGGRADYGRMAERAAQECRAAGKALPSHLARLEAEQRQLREELARLRAQQRAVLAALRAGGLPMGRSPTPAASVRGEPRR